MRIFKNKAFHYWAEELSLSDACLINAVEEIKQGLYEANLGGNLYKKRVSLGSKGKRSGARIILAFKMKEKAFFMYGFTKKKKDNITDKEEAALKMLAKIYFSYNENQIEKAIKLGEFFEVKL